MNDEERETAAGTNPLLAKALEDYEDAQAAESQEGLTSHQKDMILRYGQVVLQLSLDNLKTQNLKLLALSTLSLVTLIILANVPVFPYSGISIFATVIQISAETLRFIGFGVCFTSLTVFVRGVQAKAFFLNAPLPNRVVQAHTYKEAQDLLLDTISKEILEVSNEIQRQNLSLQAYIFLSLVSLVCAVVVLYIGGISFG